jgi:hypothetical protein
MATLYCITHGLRAIGGALFVLFEHGAQTCLTVRNEDGKTPSQVYGRLRMYDEKYGRPLSFF